MTGSLNDVDKTDALYAQDVINNLNGEGALPQGLTTSLIDAPDALTEAVGDAISGNDDYETLPGVFPGPGANSNSAAVQIAKKATRLSGGAKFKLPRG
ncbi:MAG: hypothetical protein JKY60_17740, partial [Kordiimonadaceae bacterium]|nr:hypothetical protein [Kordiimonadaceae bacterium]